MLMSFYCFCNNTTIALRVFDLGTMRHRQQSSMQHIIESILVLEKGESMCRIFFTYVVTFIYYLVMLMNDDITYNS